MVRRRRYNVSSQSFVADNRLNLYIHDYLLKHRLPAAAAALSSEAGLSETRVPVEAPEGLLYE